MHRRYKICILILLLLLFLLPFILHRTKNVGNIKLPFKTYINNTDDFSTVKFGLWLHPQEYQDGSYKDYSTFNSDVTSISINWQALEPAQYDYKWDRLHQYVDSIKKQNPDIKILLHVRSISSWATESPCKQFKDAEMIAKNIDDWSIFITNLSREFKGAISLYALSNEAAAPQNWGGCEENSADSYSTMFKAFYDAIKSGDPSAYVTNDGISSGVLMYAYGYNELFTKEAIPHTKAVEFFNGASKNHVPSGFSSTYNEQTIEKLHQDLGIKYVEPFWDMLIQNKDYIDVVSVHWYQPADYLIEVLPWVQTQFPNKHIQLWETAYGWEQAKIPGHQYRNYDYEEQAIETAKLLMIGAVYGGWVQLWPWTSIVEDEGKFPTGSVDISGKDPVYKPAAIAYKTISENLSGSMYDTTIQTSSKAVIYRFKKDNEFVYVLWSANNDTIDLSRELKDAVAIKIDGSSENIDVNNIKLSTSPLIIKNIE